MGVTLANELGIVSLVTKRLQALLDLATAIKSQNSVEPPLPIVDLVEDVDSLHDGFPAQYEQSHRLNIVETASRQIFYNLISSSEIYEVSFVEVWHLLDILILCGDRGKCTPELVCYLIEELLDSQTTHGCRIVFDYLESRKERLVQKDFHKKNLVFLRCCNELLRRLSKAEDAIFCGRVFFFLFQTFPLGDKSSVNLRGEFHTENTTKFEIPDNNGVVPESDIMDVDQEGSIKSEPVNDKTKKAPSKSGSKEQSTKTSARNSDEDLLSNHELYPIFWRLQQDFSDPTRLFAQENFQAFKKGIANTIAKFKNTPTVLQAKACADEQRGSKRKLGQNDTLLGDNRSGDDHVMDNYNPKYLTSRDLFDLELSDMAFKRHILVQSLILIDFLLSLTEKAKQKLANLETVNKSMLYQFTLNEDDAKWAIATRASITTYILSMVEGKLFHRMVETVLARDKNWIHWKVESCPTIVRDPVPAESEVEARKGAQTATRVRRLPEKAIGAISLDFLDDDIGGLDTLRDPARYTVPPISELVDGIKTDELDLEMAMDEVEKTSLENAIANKRWRVVRQLRTTKLNLLNEIEPNKDFENMLKSIAGSNISNGDGVGQAEAANGNQQEAKANSDAEIRESAVIT